MSPVWLKTELLNTYRLVLYRAAGGDDSNIKDTAFLVVDGATATIIDGVPTREGYTFAGWKSSVAGDDKIYQHGDTENGSCVISSDVTFMARWTAKDTYTVTYNANGAEDVTVPTDTTAYQKDATVTVKNGLTREGYTFNGWNTQADGKGTPYQPGATFTITGNTTLYAMWTANEAHTVTYNANGGTGTPPNR